MFFIGLSFSSRTFQNFRDKRNKEKERQRRCFGGRLMKSLLTIFALALFMNPQSASPLQTQPGQEKVEAQGFLKLGEAQTRTLAPGTIHVWSLALKANQYAVVEVTQKGIDVVARIADPNGAHRREFDSQARLSGKEKVNWITHTAGSWKLEIIPLESGRPGDYEIKWMISDEATGRDRQIVEADSLHNLARLYRIQSKYAEAEPLFRRSLEMREKILGPNHPEVAQNLNNLAVLYMNQGKYAEAEPLCRRALEMREKALEPNHPDVAVSINNLAMLYHYQGKYAEVEPLYRRSLEMREKTLGPNHLSVAVSLNNLATLYNNQGKYAEAETFHRRALEIREKTLGPNHPDVAQSFNNLAVYYKNQGKYAEAETFQWRAQEIWEKTLGPNHTNVAVSLNNLALLYNDQGKYAEAEPHFKRALAIRENALGPNHPDVAQSLNNLALLYRNQGKYTEAEPLYQRALAIQEKTLRPDHPKVACSLANLGRLYHDQGKYTEAESLINRATHIWDAITEFPDWRISAYTLRARLRKQKGNLEGALIDLSEALRSAEKLRPQIGGDEETRAGFFEKYADFFNRMVAWQIEAGQIEKAFEYAERGRSRVLLDQLAVGQIDLRSSIPADIRAPLEKRETDVKARLAEYQQRINLMRSRKDLQEDEKKHQIAELQTQLLQVERDYEQVYAEIKSASPLWQNLITASGKPVELAAIQRELIPQNSLMLYYQIGKEGSWLFVIPLSGQEVQVASLQVADSVAAILGVKTGPLTSAKLQSSLLAHDSTNASGGLLKFLGTAPDCFKPAQAKSATQRLQALWQVLIPESLWSRLVACSEVIIVPDGALHLLPFEALVVQSDVTRNHVRYWLDEGSPIRYAPSATTLYNIQGRKFAKTSAGESQKVISLAYAIFDVEALQKHFKEKSQIAMKQPTKADSSPASALAQTDWRDLPRQRFAEAARSLQPLDWSKAEAEKLRQTFRKATGKEMVLTLLDFEATERNLRAGLPDKRYIHIATHGLVDERERSSFASLALTPPATETAVAENDGFLQLYEIYEMKIPACDLAVLSACQTNVGPFFEGEGVFALSRGFLAAGAPRVVASQWQVNDKSTAELIGAFFQRVAAAEKSGNEVNYTRALWDAKRELRGQKQWAEPYFWAPFVIMGKR
jgi:CHAT domain-containing protein/Tfp pilus assembly protein PilF